MIHFGLEGLSGLILYIGAIGCLVATVFYRPIIGMYALVFLLPLQTIRYRMNQYPLGESFIGIMLLAIVIGLLRRRQSILPRNGWRTILIVYGAYLFLSLLRGSYYLGTGIPHPGDPRLSYWIEYMFMPALLVLTAALRPARTQIRIILALMALSTLAVDKSFWGAVSDRDYSNYSDDLRDAGTAGYAGSNGLAAYEAQFATLLVALAIYERRRSIRVAYYLLAVFSGLCLMYSLSRGGYLALLAGLVFLGAVKKRTILVALAVFAFSWTALVPAAVEQRVFMTYDDQSRSLDHSAETRIQLWEDAMDLFDHNPVIGTGFHTYAYMHRIGSYEDTHNYYLKVLVETGLVGLGIFVVLIGITFWQGIQCWLGARDALVASLGLGLAAWTIACAVANSFGDRWSFPQVNAYFWVLAGLAAQGRYLTETRKKSRKARRLKEPDIASETEPILC
ncbi:MAG: O-antigen ligase family protein [Acidobacteriota bacterium]|nr:O-antigen ligase family protein [Acidobacteriota bacterium]